mgnify:CR=1 FL=1
MLKCPIEPLFVLSHWLKIHVIVGRGQKKNQSNGKGIERKGKLIKIDLCIYYGQNEFCNNKKPSCRTQTFLWFKGLYVNYFHLLFELPCRVIIVNNIALILDTAKTLGPNKKYVTCIRNKRLRSLREKRALLGGKVSETEENLRN